MKELIVGQVYEVSAKSAEWSDFGGPVRIISAGGGQAAAVFTYEGDYDVLNFVHTVKGWKYAPDVHDAFGRILVTFSEVA